MQESQKAPGIIDKLLKAGIYTLVFLFFVGLIGYFVGMVRFMHGDPPRPDLMLDALVGENPGRLAVLVSSSRGRHGDRDIIYDKYWGEAPATFVMEGLDEMFVAMAVCMLHDQGKIDFSQPIAAYLPTAQSLGTTTVEQLLTHTSGIPANWTSLPENPETVDPGTGLHAPLNVQLLRELVKTVAKVPYRQFVQGQILAPLKLSTHWDEEGGHWLTTAEDLSVFEHRINSNQLVGLKTHLRAFSAIKLPDGSRGDYAYGWRVKPLYGLRMERVAADSPRFNGVVMRFPEKNFSVVLLYDGSSSQFDAKAISEKIATIYLGREMPFYRPEREGGGE